MAKREPTGIEILMVMCDDNLREAAQVCIKRKVSQIKLRIAIRVLKHAYPEGDAASKPHPPRA